MAESHDDQDISTEVIPVPSFAYGLQGLQHSTNYSVRVLCTNEMGSSPFTDWIYFQTLGLGKQISGKAEIIILLYNKLVLKAQKEPLTHFTEQLVNSEMQGTYRLLVCLLH